MSQRSRPSFEKRAREQALVERRKEKEARRAEKRARGDRSADGEDPDLAGIVAGPQPTPDWMRDGEAPPAGDGNGGDAGDPSGNPE